jgi:hypothetical protein
MPRFKPILGPHLIASSGALRYTSFKTSSTLEEPMRSCVFACAFILLLAGPSAGQTVGASVQGIVSDPTGAVLPGTTVTFKNLGTGASIQSVSDERGRYLAPFSSRENTKFRRPWRDFRQSRGAVFGWRWARALWWISSSRSDKLPIRSRL